MDNLGSCFSEDYSILIMFRKHKNTLYLLKSFFLPYFIAES